MSIEDEKLKESPLKKFQDEINEKNKPTIIFTNHEDNDIKGVTSFEEVQKQIEAENND